jgi:hypothetical protein
MSVDRVFAEHSGGRKPRGFRGWEGEMTASLIPDHYPGIVNDPGHRIADTYSITYMRALLRRANEEIG